MGGPKDQQGVTLLELILVLAVIASIIVFVGRVYYQFQFQAREQKIEATVNLLFQALEGYYYANCRQALDSASSQQTPGKLDPLVSDQSGIPPEITLNITGDLVKPGFIQMRDWQTNNPLVDKNAGDNGYYAQYNRILTAQNEDAVMSVYACMGTNHPTSCDTTSGTVLTSDSPPSGQSRVIVWTAQVAVKLSGNYSAAEWNQIKNDLHADCFSSAAGQRVNPCSRNPTTGVTQILVWTRMPSAYNPNITSDYWTANPYVTQFNRQYTNDGMATLSGITNETQNWYNPLNYLCGG